MNNAQRQTDAATFRAGFIRFMKDVSDQPYEILSTIDRFNEVGKTHTLTYVQGYIAGSQSWMGSVTHGTDFAKDLGLIAEYAEFWGQAGFSHPTP